MELKRILSVLLALMLLLTAGAALADGPELTNTAYLTKDFTYPTVVNGIAATFEFEVEEVEDVAAGYKTQTAKPSFGSISYGTGEGEQATGKQQVEVNLPDYAEAGVYKYKITEKTGATALEDGEVVYSSKVYYMYVYVEDTATGTDVKAIKGVQIVNENEEKVDAGTEGSYGMIFTNSFNRNGGSKDDSQDGDASSKYALKITKAVEGTEDKDTVFEFTITFAAYTGFVASDSVKFAPEATGGSAKASWEKESDNTYTFSLKAGDDLELSGIPAGFTYTITETAANNWAATASVVSDSKTAVSYGANNAFNKGLTVKDVTIGDEHNSVDFTNTYNDIPATGVIINALPYALMVIVGVGALALFIVMKRRRYAQEEQ